MRTPEVHRSPDPTGRCAPGSHRRRLSVRAVRSPGLVHSWCKARRAVACRPGATSCKNGRRASGDPAYGPAFFIRQRCLLGQGVSGYALEGALASWPDVIWVEWHTFWRVEPWLPASGHLPRGPHGFWGPVSWSFLWARRWSCAHRPSAQGLWAEGWPNGTVLWRYSRGHVLAGTEPRRTAWWSWPPWWCQTLSACVSEPKITASSSEQ